MSKHTSGPWELTVERSSCAGVNITFGISSESHVGIASGQSQEHLGENIGICEDECRANARLIAAAPDLLGALKQLLDAFEASIHDHDESPACIRARAAIAKAGEQE